MGYHEVIARYLHEINVSVYERSGVVLYTETDFIHIGYVKAKYVKFMAHGIFNYLCNDERPAIHTEFHYNPFCWITLGGDPHDKIPTACKRCMYALRHGGPCSNEFSDPRLAITAMREREQAMVYHPDAKRVLFIMRIGLAEADKALKESAI